MSVECNGVGDRPLDMGASPSGDRAVVNGAGQAVSAVPASVPSAYCGYWLEGTTWDCRGDGYLWDADGDGYDPNDHSNPCPKCNTLAYLQSKAELAQCLTSYQWIDTSGAEHWRNGVEIASAANPQMTERALAGIGPVVCLDWENPDAPDWNRTVQVIENASAIEARSGATAGRDPQDESAVPQADAQPAASPTPEIHSQDHRKAGKD